MRIFFFTFILMSLLACKSKETIKSTDTQNAVRSIQLDDFISLDRTGCFGSCPIYQLKVFRDGSVQYFGRKFVDNEGIFKAQLNKQQVNDLFAKIDALIWEDFPEQYPMDNVDFPQFKVEVKLGEMQKSIRGNTNADKDLLKLTQYLDDVFDTLSLEKITENEDDF